MDRSLYLNTKLLLPPLRPGLVLRPRLLALLDQGQHSPLTLVAAGAGFGKTTLVSHWLHQRLADQQPGRVTRVAWVSLEVEDNDLTRFWGYLLTAIDGAVPGAAAPALALLHTPQPPPFESLLTVLLNRLLQTSDELLLVLDDYHVLTTPAIHQGLASLITHLPPHMHLILLSRADPTLPLARLRARGQITEIRAADLRFRRDESAAFLREMMGLSLPPEQLEALEARTEGWAAGLQLVVLALREQADPAAFLAAFNGSHRYVLDYLVEEVLERQPAHLQHFLLQTAIVERLCGPLADALMGLDTAEPGHPPGTGPAPQPTAYSQLLLAELERRQLFLVPLDQERRWYRYHHLFAAALRSRLHALAPERAAPLHRRAAAWFAAQGLHAEAVAHALAAGDAARAADSIEAAAAGLWRRGETTTLRGWLEALPAELLGERAQLGLWDAWTLLSGGHWPAIEARLAAIERTVAAAPASSPALGGQLVALQAQVARVRGEASRSLLLSQQALDALPPDDQLWRGRVLVNLAGVCWAMGDAEGALHWYAEAGAFGASMEDHTQALTAWGLQGGILTDLGRLAMASALFEQALAYASARGLRAAPVVGYSLLGLGRIRYEQNELEIAQALLEEAFDLGQRGDIGDVILQGSLALAALYQTQGEHARALATLRAAAQASRDWGLPYVPDLLAAQRAWLQLRAGDVAGATSAAPIDDSAPAPDPVRNSIQLLRAYLHLGQGQGAAALQLLDALQETSLVYAGSPLLAPLLRALALDATGRTGEALQVLRPTLTRATQSGMLRTAIDLGPMMARLLARLSEDGHSDEPPFPYLQRLLAAFPDEARRLALPLSEPPSSGSMVREQPDVPVEPLSAREQEVLRLLAEGATNQAIAETLIITERTAKKHVANILAKLGAANRTQAVARARAYGLL